MSPPRGEGRKGWGERLLALTDVVAAPGTQTWTSSGLRLYKEGMISSNAGDFLHHSWDR